MKRPNKKLSDKKRAKNKQKAPSLREQFKNYQEVVHLLRDSLLDFHERVRRMEALLEGRDKVVAEYLTLRKTAMVVDGIFDTLVRMGLIVEGEEEGTFSYNEAAIAKIKAEGWWDVQEEDPNEPNGC